MENPVLYIPILTTLLSAGFAAAVFRRWSARGRPLHLLWWGIGIILFGAGTLAEGVTTVFGWHEPVFRWWYITGALLGGAPLAQGTVYLLLPRPTAHVLAVMLVAVVLVAGVCVLAAPVDASKAEEHILSGEVLEWSWVRAFSPVINTYAFIFLVGGALASALRYSGSIETRDRFAGNILIAIGAILPGIGGSFSRFGFTEVLYVTEFIGIILIYLGYRANTASRPAPQLRPSGRTAPA